MLQEHQYFPLSLMIVLQNIVLYFHQAFVAFVGHWLGNGYQTHISQGLNWTWLKGFIFILSNEMTQEGKDECYVQSFMLKAKLYKIIKSTDAGDDPIWGISFVFIVIPGIVIKLYQICLQWYTIGSWLLSTRTTFYTVYSTSTCFICLNKNLHCIRILGHRVNNKCCYYSKLVKWSNIIGRNVCFDIA